MMTSIRVENQVFRDFFLDVFERQLYEFQVTRRQLEDASESMRLAYAPNDKFCATQPAVDYDNAESRCVYLCRYATVHSSLIQSVLLESKDILECICNENDKPEFCCLGGGSGTDLVGIAAALSSVDVRSNKIYRITTVDRMEGWFFTHHTIYKAAERKEYNLLGKFLRKRISSSFICDDILSPSVQTVLAINKADMVTMIKFISEVPTELAPGMLKRIIKWMKPKALLLFADNSGGGFYEIMEDAAEEHGLKETEVSCRYRQFEVEVSNEIIYNLYTLSSLKVAVKMWEKPELPDKLNDQK